ncbi:hypothetical protein AAHH78_39270, partial [Burkholderia pseudomallei]
GGGRGYVFDAVVIRVLRFVIVLVVWFFVVAVVLRGDVGGDGGYDIGRGVLADGRFPFMLSVLSVLAREALRRVCVGVHR